LQKFLVTPLVSKHRLFAWLPSQVLPENLLFAFARDDDFFFGVLQSHYHETWSLRMGTSLEDRPRYTSTSTFETFPLPFVSDDLKRELGRVAAELAHQRDQWVNPPGASALELKKRTLTNLYNERPTWLANVHATLDGAVASCYGWPKDIGDDEVLQRLLELNLQREPA
jgi:hypothetical protein